MQIPSNNITTMKTSPLIILSEIIGWNSPSMDKVSAMVDIKEGERRKYGQTFTNQFANFLADKYDTSKLGYFHANYCENVDELNKLLDKFIEDHSLEKLPTI